MSKIIRLTESDLVRIVKRVINEAATGPYTVGGKKYNLVTLIINPIIRRLFR